jgi:hypothetical protein
MAASTVTFHVPRQDPTLTLRKVSMSRPRSCPVRTQPSTATRLPKRAAQPTRMLRMRAREIEGSSAAGEGDDDDATTAASVWRREGRPSLAWAPVGVDATTMPMNRRHHSP